MTAAPLWAPSAPATATQFVAYAPLGGMCAFGSLTGSCVSAVVHDNSVVTLAPNVTAGQSCVTGATDLFVVAWGTLTVPARLAPTAGAFGRAQTGIPE